MTGGFNMENIISKVCKLSECNEIDVITKSRKAEVVRARQILVSYNHLVLLKTQEISGKEFNVNHSTVIHCIKVVQNEFETNKKYRELFGEILLNNKKMLTHKFNSYDRKQITFTKLINPMEK